MVYAPTLFKYYVERIDKASPQEIERLEAGIDTIASRVGAERPTSPKEAWEALRELLNVSE